MNVEKILRVDAERSGMTPPTTTQRKLADRKEPVLARREVEALDLVVRINGGTSPDVTQDAFACRYWSANALEEWRRTKSEAGLRIDSLIPTSVLLRRLMSRDRVSSKATRGFLREWSIECVLTDAEALRLRESTGNDIPLEWEFGLTDHPWNGGDRWARYRKAFSVSGIVVHWIVWNTPDPFDHPPVKFKLQPLNPS
jgi:hypothetical protein